MKRIAATLACAGAVLAPGAVSAQATDSWQMGISVYGWFPSLSGSTSFAPSPGGGSSDISVGAEDIIESMRFVLMGSFEARKGRWGGFTDFIYMDVGDTKTQTRNFLLGEQQVPADVSGNVAYDMKSYVWTVAGEYRAVVEPGLEVDTFLGVRMLDVEQTLKIDLSGNVGSIALPDRSTTRSSSVTNWDGIVGVKGRISFGVNRAWFVPYYGDIGAGDSDLTYQLMSGIGYSFEWGEMVAQWRYLSYDIGGAIDSLSFSGPAVAVNFRW